MWRCCAACGEHASRPEATLQPSLELKQEASRDQHSQLSIMGKVASGPSSPHSQSHSSMVLPSQLHWLPANFDRMLQFARRDYKAQQGGLPSLARQPWIDCPAFIRACSPSKYLNAHRYLHSRKFSSHCHHLPAHTGRSDLLAHHQCKTGHCFSSMQA